MKRIILMLLLGVLPVAVNAGSLESWGDDYYDLVTDSPAGTDFIAVAAGGWHSLALKAIPAVVDITQNTLHPHHDGSGSLNDLVRVKVFGSMTSVGDPVDLDTADIDLATVRFGPGLAAQASGKAVFNGDYDSDGIQDKKFRFRMGDVAFDKVTCTDSSGTLTGKLTTGEAFEGSDSFTSNCVAGCH